MKKIITTKYVGSNKITNKKSFKWLTLILISLSIFLFSGCILVKKNAPPISQEHDEQPIPRFEEIENTFFDGYLRVSPHRVYQEDYDTIAFKIDVVPWNTTKQLKSLYIKGKSLDIIKGQAFGNNLKVKTINEEIYFYIDLVENNLTGCMEFFILLDFDKNSFYRNVAYSDIVKDKIAAHSFDIYINYEYEDVTKHNLRFFFSGANPSYSNEEKIILYNNIEDILTKTYYSQLYLPNENLYKLAKENIYYPNSESKYLGIKTGINSVLSFTLAVWVSDYGISYGGQPKVIYQRNGIDFTIITHEAHVVTDYSLDFTAFHKESNQKVQYSYIIKAKSIDEVKEFADTIELYMLKK